jgi:eukaryotic-like serine/threonine-protein kinase
LEVGGKVDYDTECKLGDRVGWRKEGKWVNYDYDDLTFNQKPAPVGHLPGNGFWRAWLWFDFNLISSSLASRAVSCNL